MVVYADGSINWIPPGIFTLSCKLNILWFPFDEQRCHFKVRAQKLPFCVIDIKCYVQFGSWTYDGTKLDLQADESGLDMSEYMINGEWDLYSTFDSFLVMLDLCKFCMIYFRECCRTFGKVL